MGSVAPGRVGSSQTRAQTRVPCTGRRIIKHCATREVPVSALLTFGLGNYLGGAGVCVCVRVSGRVLFRSW